MQKIHLPNSDEELQAECRFSAYRATGKGAACECDRQRGAAHSHPDGPRGHFSEGAQPVFQQTGLPRQIEENGGKAQLSTPQTYSDARSEIRQK